MEVRTIDYVVPMVFHDDPLWRSDLKAANSQYDDGNLIDFVRFRSWHTEHLLIQCVRRFMPFVRTVFVILARESQKRAWMDEEGVTVVYHRDIIPAEYLPTFNSCCIEMFLHRLPGLSERFLYGNDDMYPLSPLTESDFFDGDVPCLHHYVKPFPDAPNIFHVSCLNGLRFVAKEFGVTYDHTWLKGGHSITPMLKGTWEYLWKRGEREIRESISPFREPRNFNQWLCPWWHYHAGNYVDRVPNRKYVSTRDSLDDVVSAMNDENAGIVCVNDHESVSDYMRYGRAVIEVLKKKYGIKEQDDDKGNS